MIKFTCFFIIIINRGFGTVLLASSCESNYPIKLEKITGLVLVACKASSFYVPNIQIQWRLLIGG